MSTGSKESLSSSRMNRWLMFDLYDLTPELLKGVFFTVVMGNIMLWFMWKTMKGIFFSWAIVLCFIAIFGLCLAIWFNII